MKNDDDSRDYPVGYGKPPKHSQFKKGKSGNPGGKRKGQRSIKTITREIFAEPIQANRGGKKIKIPTSEAFIRKTINDGLNGDKQSKLITLQLLERYGFTDAEEDTAPTAQSLLDSATLFAMMRDIVENDGSAEAGRSSASDENAARENKDER